MPASLAAAGDADGGEQAADGGRDQGDEQRQQIEPGHLGAVVVEEPGQGGHHQQEDQGQPYQQGVQRHLVGGLLPLGPFHQGNHAIQRAFARVVADVHPDLVGNDGGVAGHAAAVGARLADDGGGFAGDGRLVDRGDAGDHFAVGRDHLAAAHQHQIAFEQAGGRYPLALVILRAGDPTSLELAHAGLQTVGPRLAAPLGQGLGEVGKPEGEPEPGGQLPGQRRSDAGERLPQQRLQGRHHGRQPESEQDGAAKQRPGIEAIEGFHHGLQDL